MTTKGASFSYEEVIDLHTESDRVTVIGIHTPTSDTPRRMAPGLFAQFKKYKYLGCSVTMVPAATLPVDPLGVSYEAGEPTVDPRDMLNPILFHGCHGNDLGNILNRIYTAGSVEGSDLSQLLHSDATTLWSMVNESSERPDDVIHLNVLESLYYRALTDRTWQKANIQRGFRKTGLHPRIYTLATNMQLQNAEYLMSDQFPAAAPWTGDESTDPYLGKVWDVEDTTANPVRFFTPRTQRLGWLDTRQVVPYTATDPYDGGTPNPSAEIKQIIKVSEVDTKLPRIYMGVILLPPAYKQEQYFRMIVTHRFAFAGFRGISMSNLELENPNYFNLNEKISEGGSDDPDDPDDPDPPTPPEPPTPTYSEKVVVSGPVAGMTGVYSGTTYSKMDIYDSNGSVVFSLEGDVNANYISTAQGSGISGTPWLGTPSGTELTYPTIILQSSGGGINFVRQNNYQSSTVFANFDDFIDELENNGNTVSTTFTTLADLKAAWQYSVVVADDE